MKKLKKPGNFNEKSKKSGKWGIFFRNLANLE
jgi:hypothetical protein